MIAVKNLNPDYSKLYNEGSYGDIYRCKEVNDILVKVIKKCDSGGSGNGEFNKKIIKQLNHKNIMKIFGVQKSPLSNDIYFIYIQYINGITLNEYLMKYKKLPSADIMTIIKQIFAGLHFIHQRKITHRDIKLENIIVDGNLNTTIVDFGLAYYGLPCKNIVGTSGFFAPEMIYSPNSYGSKCDIWSTGCVLYFMVCRYMPLYFSEIKECYIEQINSRVEIKYYEDVWKDYGGLKDLCKKMLVYDCESRLGSGDFLYN